MKHSGILLISLSYVLAFPSVGQEPKTVEGIRFSTCLGNPDLKDDFYNGKFLVIDFWATWCGPCIGAMPHLRELEEHYAANPEIVFATMTSESKEKTETFLGRRKELYLTTHPLIDDDNRSWKYFDMNRIPRTIVFSPAGTIVYDGHPMELGTGELDRILAGESPVEIPVPPAPAAAETPDWRTIAERASYFALTQSSEDTLAEPWYSCSASGEELLILAENYSVGECVGIIGNISPLRIRTNDAGLFVRQIVLYAHLSHNRFTEYDAGVFGTQHRNQLLYLLEKNYGFCTTWKEGETTVVFLQATDRTMLNNNFTLSEYGRSSSWSGNTFVLVNYSLEELSEAIETALVFPFPVLPEKTHDTHTYDFTLDLTSEESLRVSLAAYGLTISAPVKEQLQLLHVDFSTGR